jgi:methylmalonyl-CoA/ethylmalonyl-CoA epimerase
MEMPGSIIMLDHTAITVKDLDRSIAFYSEVLNFPLLSRKKNAELNVEYASVQVGQSAIEIICPIGSKLSNSKPTESGMTGVAARMHMETGLNHISLRVDNMDSVCRMLKSKGVKFLVEPRLTGSGSKFAFFTDPDGTLIELIQRT